MVIPIGRLEAEYGGQVSVIDSDESGSLDSL
jgi:hypothetical protein